MPKGKSPRVSELSIEELRAELARREAATAAPSLTDMELAGEAAGNAYKESLLRARIEHLPPEDHEPKKCPRCGRLVRVRVKTKARTVRTLSGEFGYRRNYHYCEDCRAGFYPRDRELGMPEEGDVSFELEKRILDFGVTESFEHAAERWSVHYARPISSNLVRRVIDRVGRRCEASDERYLQHALLEPPKRRSEVLVIQNDGGMLPMRGAEPWREAKLAVVYREEDHVRGVNKRACLAQARYVGVLGGQEEFAQSLGRTLHVVKATRAKRVVWLADGALGNWNLAATLAPNCVEILDWYHAIENAMTGGKAALGEGHCLLADWRRRCEHLLSRGEPERLIDELLECVADTDTGTAAQLDSLARYYRTNTQRMRYAQFRAEGLPIGSGAVESGHKHVLQERMKRAGQRWSTERARRMVRLRTAFRTAGPTRFHHAIRLAAATTKAAPLSTRALRVRFG